MTALLFGSFLGITTDQVVLLAAVAIVALAVSSLAGRPLWFASVDEDLAAARGIPVTGLGVVFLLLLAVTAAAAAHITGSLLVMPAATARRLTARPLRGAASAVSLGLAATWIGLTIAFSTPYPLGFLITTIAFGAYTAATAARRGIERIRAC